MGRLIWPQGLTWLVTCQESTDCCLNGLFLVDYNVVTGNPGSHVSDVSGVIVLASSVCVSVSHSQLNGKHTKSNFGMEVKGKDI